MRVHTLMLSLAALPFLALARSNAAGPDPKGVERLVAPYETRDVGERLYVRQGCYQCHGLVGQGSILSGPALSPLRLDAGAFRSYVRNPRGAMPPYSAHILPDADLVRIEVYLRGIKPAQAYAAIPMLAATLRNAGAGSPVKVSGSGIYDHNCAACHGARREGGIGPSLVDQGQKRDAASIAALIMAPPAKMPRLYPQPLSRSDVDAVAQFVARGS